MRKRNKLIFGFGINDADYSVAKTEIQNGKHVIVWRCPFYQTWTDMLRRCYSRRVQLKKPTYVGCYTDEVWKYFSNFKVWMEKQDWEGKQLDKDLLFHGNKAYSDSTCVFISGSLNRFLTDRVSARGDYPIGVHFSKINSKYAAQCSDPFTGERGYLGYFTDPMLAHEAWRARKHEIACQYADMQTDQRISEALRMRYLK